MSIVWSLLWLWLLLDGVVQAAFAPADKAALQAAVGTCEWSNCGTSGCLSETSDGSCPIFAASNDASGNPHGVIGEWDVSRVTSFESLFQQARSFNSDISKWRTSRVTNMQSMFHFARKFNADITLWNVSSVTNLESTFFYASTFNQDIGNWSVSRVTTLKSTFSEAVQFQHNLNNWITSKVTTMESTFNSAPFNQPLHSW